MAKNSAKKFPTSQRKKWQQILQTSAASASHGAKTSPSLKIVLDTNVWYSALIYGGIPEDVVRFCLNQCQVVLSETLIEELIDRLKHKANGPYRWLNFIRASLGKRCTVIQTGTADIKIRDISDIHIIAAALDAGCDYIVTGDQDLLSLKAYKGIIITSPAEFALIFSC